MNVLKWSPMLLVHPFLQLVLGVQTVTVSIPTGLCYQSSTSSSSIGLYSVDASSLPRQGLTSQLSTASSNSPTFIVTSSASSKTSVLSSKSISLASSGMQPPPGSATTKQVSISSTASPNPMIVQSVSSSGGGYAYLFQGCYIGVVNKPVLNGPAAQDSSLTPEFCADFCATYSYFGLQNGYECLCGSSLSATLANLMDCNQPCYGNSAQYCGSNYFVQIYNSRSFSGSMSSGSASKSSVAPTSGTSSLSFSGTITLISSQYPSSSTSSGPNGLSLSTSARDLGSSSSTSSSTISTLRTSTTSTSPSPPVNPLRSSSSTANNPSISSSSTSPSLSLIQPVLASSSSSSGTLAISSSIPTGPSTPVSSVLSSTSFASYSLPSSSSNAPTGLSSSPASTGPSSQVTMSMSVPTSTTIIPTPPSSRFTSSPSILPSSSTALSILISSKSSSTSTSSPATTLATSTSSATSALSSLSSSIFTSIATSSSISSSSSTPSSSSSSTSLLSSTTPISSSTSTPSSISKGTSSTSSASSPAITSTSPSTISSSIFSSIASTTISTLTTSATTSTTTTSSGTSSFTSSSTAPSSTISSTSSYFQVPTEAVINPSFEIADASGNHATPWELASGVDIQNNGKAYDGSDDAVFNWSSEPQTLNQTLIDLCPGASYTFQYYYAFTGGTSPVNFAFCYLETTIGGEVMNLEYLDASMNATIDSHNYRSESATYLASSNSAILSIIFTCDSSITTAILYFDLITLTTSNTTCSASSPSSTASSTTLIRLSSPTPVVSNAQFYDQYDDEQYSINLPFEMSLYYNNASIITVTTNGILSVGQPNGASKAVNKDIQTLYTYELVPGTACLWWEDLAVSTGSQQGIYYQIIGASGQQRLDVEYILTKSGDNSGTIYHAILSYLANQPGEVIFYYFSDGDEGANATVGIQGQDVNGDVVAVQVEAGEYGIIHSGVQIDFTTTPEYTLSGTYVTNYAFNPNCYPPGTFPEGDGGIC